MAGAGYKLFTTGQVLTAAEVNTYLQEQVIMVFNDATARTTALSGVLAEGMVSYLKSTKVVEIYNGTAWASLDDPNAIQNTIVDAKGDLISASAADVPARIAVGNNGETLVADSSTSTGLRYTAGNAVGNPVLNSAFQIWQRGTSFAGTIANTNTYGPDRWVIYRDNYTFSRQTTSDSTNLPNIEYCTRVQRNSGQTTTSASWLVNQFEVVNSIAYAGKTVTVSFYARAGANYSNASNGLRLNVSTGTGTDSQRVLDGFTGGLTAIDYTPSLTTTWQRFSATATLSSTLTQLAISFSSVGVGTAGANDYYEVTGVQLDLGSVALPFRTYSATLAGELLAAQRYYWRVGGDNVRQYFGNGMGAATTNAFIFINNPVIMRTAPTSVDFSTLSVYDSATYTAISSLAIGRAGANGSMLDCTVASGLTVNRPYFLVANNSTSAYLGFSAEL